MHQSGTAFCIHLEKLSLPSVCLFDKSLVSLKKNAITLFHFLGCVNLFWLEQGINQFAQLSFQFPLVLLVLIWSLITTLGASTLQGFHCAEKVMDSFSQAGVESLLIISGSGL